MKLLAIQTTLLAVSSVSCLTASALTTRSTKSIRTTSRSSLKFNHEALPLSHRLGGDAVKVKKNEKSLLYLDSPFIDLVIRGFTPPKPPPPPPLPPSVPRPRPIPAAPRPGGSIEGPGGIAPRPKPNPGPDSNETPRDPPPAPVDNWSPIKADEVPGQMGSDLGGETKAMSDYEKSGQDQLNDYKNAKQTGKPDTAIVKVQGDTAGLSNNEAFMDWREISGYKSETTSLSIRDVQDLQKFKSQELGFSLVVPPRFVSQIAVKDAGNGLINRGTYDSEGFFIVYQDAFKERNDAVPGKIPLNEMGMQNFINSATDATKSTTKSTNFRAAIFSDIQNKQFWDITRQNYNDMKQPFSSVLTFESDTVQFQRLMGSPNINSKLYSFRNHHNAIGNRLPVRIILIPKQAEGSGGKFTAALIFE